MLNKLLYEFIKYFRFFHGEHMSSARNNLYLCMGYLFCKEFCVVHHS